MSETEIYSTDEFGDDFLREVQDKIAPGMAHADCLGCVAESLRSLRKKLVTKNPSATISALASVEGDPGMASLLSAVHDLFLRRESNQRG